MSPEKADEDGFSVSDYCYATKYSLRYDDGDNVMVGGLTFEDTNYTWLGLHILSYKIFRYLPDVFKLFENQVLYSSSEAKVEFTNSTSNAWVIGNSLDNQITGNAGNNVIDGDEVMTPL